MDPGSTYVYRQERITGKASPVGVAVVVGQAVAGSDPLPLGSVLRAAVLRPLPRFQAGEGMSYRSCGDIGLVARDNVVHRGRHLPMFRPIGSYSAAIHSGRGHSRQPLLA